MSGVPFNPMRKTPPPPPHIDTVGLTPTEYILLSSCDGHVFVAHRECLCGSPVFRRAFAKRYNIVTDDVVVAFDDAARTLHSSTSPWDQPRPSDKPRTSMLHAGTSDESDAPEVAFAPTVDERPEDAALEAAAALRPVVVNESLQNDNTIVITFPRYSAAVVDLLLAYLYYKQRHDGVSTDPRPPFDVPKEHAIEMFKLAEVLEC